MYIIFTAIFIVGLIGRIYYVLPSMNKKGAIKLSSKEKLRTAIVIGSGGHTAEILRVASRLNNHNYSPRYYIMASSDTTSASQVLKVEKNQTATDFTVVKIPRSRHVGQSYSSSVFTTGFSTLYCLPILLKLRPQLILCNGPGTCVPICFIVFLMKVFFISNSRIIFVESVCRVKTLSLTGYLLYLIADLFFVQWPELSEKYKQSLYVGRL